MALPLIARFLAKWMTSELPAIPPGIAVKPPGCFARKYEVGLPWKKSSCRFPLLEDPNRSAKYNWNRIAARDHYVEPLHVLPIKLVPAYR